MIGSPGKVVRQLSDEQIEALKAGAQHYVENMDWFKQELRSINDEDDGIQSRL